MSVCAKWLLLAIVLCAGVRVGWTAASKLTPETGAPQDKKTPDGKATKTSEVSSNDGRLGDSPKIEDTPGADYVPCKLTLAQLKMLQRPEVAQTLSPHDVDQLQASLVASVLKTNPDAAMTGPWLRDLLEELSGKKASDRLAGLTPSQALAVVLSIVREQRDKKTTQADVAWYAEQMRKALAVKSTDAAPVTSVANLKEVSAAMSAQGKEAGTGGTEAVSELIASLAEIVKDGTPRSALYGAVTSKVLTSGVELGDKSLIIQSLKQAAPLDVEDLIDKARQFLLKLERPADIGCSMSLLTWREVEFAFGYLIANEYVAVQVVVRNLSDKEQFVLHDVEFEVDADPTGRLGRYYSGRDKVVVRALANTQATGDPRNITLSVATGIGQIMSSAQTIFGGQLADATGVFNGGFMSGLKNGWKDLSGDQMKMIDDNTFSSTPSSQTVVPKQGTVVFYTFIPSKQFEEGWWTQPCVETMYEGRLDSGGRLSNLSRGTYGQQVTTGGTADEPAGVDVRRALEICARLPQVLDRQHSLWGTMWKKGVLLEKTPKGDLQELHVPAEPVPAEEVPAEEVPTIVGKDALPSQERPGSRKCEVKKREACLRAGKNAQCEVVDDMAASKSCPPAQTVWPTNTAFEYELFRPAYRRPYKKWSGNSLAIFRELANTVVAGVHTLEDTDGLPSVAALDCGTQVDSKGTVDFSKVTGDSLSCTLTGKNLSVLPKVRLRNAGDATDEKFADASVTVVGDPTKATVGWAVTTLHSLPGTNYLVYGVTATSAELKSSAALHLPDIPFATAVTNGTGTGTVFDFSKDATAQVMTVTGNHLDKVTGLVLTPAVDTNVLDAATKDAKDKADAAKKEKDLAMIADQKAVDDQTKATTAKAAFSQAVAAAAKNPKDVALAAKVKEAKALSDQAAAKARASLAASKTEDKKAKDAEAAANQAQSAEGAGAPGAQAAGTRKDTGVIAVGDTAKQSLTQVTFKFDATVLKALGTGGATLKLQPADDTKTPLGITVTLKAN